MGDLCRTEFVTDSNVTAESNGYPPSCDVCRIEFLAENNGYGPRLDLCRTVFFG